MRHPERRFYYSLGITSLSRIDAVWHFLGRQEGFCVDLVTFKLHFNASEKSVCGKVQMEY